MNIIRITKKRKWQKLFKKCLDKSRRETVEYMFDNRQPELAIKYANHLIHQVLAARKYRKLKRHEWWRETFTGNGIRFWLTSLGFVIFFAHIISVEEISSVRIKCTIYFLLAAIPCSAWGYHLQKKAGSFQDTGTFLINVLGTAMWVALCGWLLLNVIYSIAAAI